MGFLLDWEKGGSEGEMVLGLCRGSHVETVQTHDFTLDLDHKRRVCRYSRYLRWGRLPFPRQRPDPL